MLDKKKIALVTGANRGIGFEVCRQLAKKDFRVILTSRDPVQGELAVNTLKKAGLPIIYHKLDVTESKSIVKLANFLRDEVKQLDVLVNNAAIHLDWEDSLNASVFETKIETLRQTMETNVYGCLTLCQALIPLMKERNYGRVVNVSSSSGQLSNMEKITNVSISKSSDGFTIDEFGHIVWGGHLAYRISKTAINVLTRILAAELEGTNILVNSVDPGYTRTDMSRQNGERTPEQAADTIVWLATLPDFSLTGKFFKDRKPIPW